MPRTAPSDVQGVDSSPQSLDQPAHESRGIWFRWLRSYFSKASIEGTYKGWLAFPIYTWLIWIYPKFIAIVPFALALVMFMVVAGLRDLIVQRAAQRPISSWRERAVRELGPFSLIALGFAFMYLGVCIPGYSEEVATWAEDANMDGPVAQAVLIMATLTLMTTVLAIAMVKTLDLLSEAPKPAPKGKTRRRDAEKANSDGESASEGEDLIKYGKMIGRHANFVHESAWLFFTVTIALIPGAFVSSLGPNLVAGFMVPLLVTHAREDYRRFRESNVATAPSIHC